MNITVVGLGYMGLPFAFLLAKAGYMVKGFDINKTKIDLLNQGKLPFDEKDLGLLFEEVKKTANFKAINVIEKSDVFIVSVPTPEKNHALDLTFVLSAIDEVMKVMENENLVIIESTIGPKTCETILKPILDKKNVKYGLVHCPERAIPGNTLYELVNNDRVVGGLSNEDALKAKEIYSSFVKGNIHLTNITVAEVCKLSENTYRDINIAYANELAQICDELGINVWDVISLSNKHPRVKILNPGPGVGGHCIAIDPWFLCEDSIKSKLVPLARELNDNMPYFVVDKLLNILNDNKSFLNSKKVLILGLSYKADVDDDRESPSYKVISILKTKGANVKVFDPFFLNKSDFKDLSSAFKWSEIVVLTTNHKQFIDEINSKYLNNVELLFDTRNCLLNLANEKKYYRL